MCIVFDHIEGENQSPLNFDELTAIMFFFFFFIIIIIIIIILLLLLLFCINRVLSPNYQRGSLLVFRLANSVSVNTTLSISYTSYSAQQKYYSRRN
jgi:hypothetical protein